VAVVLGDDEIKLGDPFKARMAGTGGKAGKGGPASVASHSVEVKLKAGQRVEAVVSVTGEDRKAGVAILDPDGKVLTTSWGLRGGEQSSPRGLMNSFGNLVQFPKKAGATVGKSAKASVGEVPVTGKYTVTVFSDLAGDFSLLVRDPSRAASRDADAIRRELDEARKRVEELEKELREKEKGEKPEAVTGPRPVRP
jgi:hypothetical protein